MRKICKCCGKEFEGYNTSKYCSKKCEKEINVEIRCKTKKITKLIKPFYCEICGKERKELVDNRKRNGLQIHHVKYEFPIKRKDIMILCPKCHHKLHAHWNIKKVNILPILESNIKRSEKVKKIAKIRKISRRMAQKIIYNFFGPNSYKKGTTEFFLND